MSMPLPFVSVIVPSRNRAAMLSDCLTSLRGQDYPGGRFEIIVVDDGSTDATADVVRTLQDGELPEVRYVYQDHHGLNAARNAGITAAKEATICFVDDDVDVPRGWLRSLAEAAVRHPEAGCLGGPIRVRLEGKPPRCCQMELERSEGALDYGLQEKAVHEVYGGNILVKRWAVDEVGPFHESLSGPYDEIEWQRRLQGKKIGIVYAPSAWLWHRRTQADLQASTLLKRKARQGLRYAEHLDYLGDDLLLSTVLGRVFLHALHAARRRCFFGVLRVAWDFGFIWGTVRKRGRNWRRRGGSRHPPGS